MGMRMSHALFYCDLLLCLLIAFCLIHGYIACYIKRSIDSLSNSIP